MKNTITPIPINLALVSFDPQQWVEKTQRANLTFADNKLALAYQQYLDTHKIAQQLFSQFKSFHPIPDSLTPILVISYLNIADCRAKQNKKKEQINCLFEIYIFLKNMFSEPLISEDLRLQIFQGIHKVHPEICLCLRRSEDREELKKINADFSKITTIYQTQTWDFH